MGNFLQAKALELVGVGMVCLRATRFYWKDLEIKWEMVTEQKFEMVHGFFVCLHLGSILLSQGILHYVRVAELRTGNDWNSTLLHEYFSPIEVAAIK